MTAQQVLPHLAAGVSDDGESLGKLGEAVYRGVLHALPASARAWFGDLRDRGLSTAVEVMPLCHTQLLEAYNLLKPRRISWDACCSPCVVCVHNSREAVLSMLLAFTQASALSLSA